MLWITRQHPDLDRLACPWLIRRFIDPQAQILFLPAEEVIEKSTELGGIPFDIAGVEFPHFGQKYSLDSFLKKYTLTDPALQTMASIIRGAGSDHPEPTPQAAGLWAISAGLAYNMDDEQAWLAQGLNLYDALYSWATQLWPHRHTQQPEEHLLLQLFNTYLVKKTDRKSTLVPWATELRHLIQDSIDTNVILNFETDSGYRPQDFAQKIDHPAFGDTIQNVRLEKATQMLLTSSYSLSEIAFLSGFSDQGSFSRIFKKRMGQNPSLYRKNNQKGKIESSRQTPVNCSRGK